MSDLLLLFSRIKRHCVKIVIGQQSVKMIQHCQSSAQNVLFVHTHQDCLLTIVSNSGCCRRCGSFRGWNVEDHVNSVFTALSGVWPSLLFFLHFSPFGPLGLEVGSPRPVSPSRASSAAPLAARQSLRLPLALSMLDPSSIKIHHDILQHVLFFPAKPRNERSQCTRGK